MDIWIIVSQSGMVRENFGWFDSEEECEKICRQLRIVRNDDSKKYIPKKISQSRVGSTKNNHLYGKSLDKRNNKCYN